MNGGRPVEVGLDDGGTRVLVDRPDGDATTFGDGTVVGD
jgi:hypothetical protein